MTSKDDPADIGHQKELILSVVRGERPLADLRVAGVSLRFRDIDPISREILARPLRSLSLEVAPSSFDLASGLLAHRNRPQALKDWGTFILASGLIDLEPLEVEPHGDLILNGVWDASFEGRLNEEVERVAWSLVR